MDRTEQPRASVIIRTYNRPQLLRRAVESVAKQTWRNLELVVANDAGEDVSELLDAFRGDFEKPEDLVYLNWSQEEKPGRCTAGNLAVEASSGDWMQPRVLRANCSRSNSPESRASSAPPSVALCPSTNFVVE